MRKIFEIASEKQGAKQLELSAILFQYISLVNKLGVKKSQEGMKTIFGADEDSAASLGRTARAPVSAKDIGCGYQARDSTREFFL
jgi:hypothetical protein